MGGPGKGHTRAAEQRMHMEPQRGANAVARLDPQLAAWQREAPLSRPARPELATHPEIGHEIW